MELWSSAFEPGQPIPIEYTKDGDGYSPPLEWRNVPDGTQELAVVMEDLSAGGDRPFTHWVVYKIPPDMHALPEGIKHEAIPSQAENQVLQGQNSLAHVGYDGPSPPMGRPHQYVFRLLALDQALEPLEGLSKEELLDATSGHVIEEADLEAFYERPR